MTGSHQTVRPRLRSIALLTLVWFLLQIGGLFRPGLLDDVDSIYIEVAREMLHRHDFVTPYVDGIRFFDKPPLMYWMAAGSMRVFGEHAWAARLPLALAVLALVLCVYLLGLRWFAHASPLDDPDRGGLYAALATATALGCYLYTRFFIPDILICLWLTLGIHLFLIATDRAAAARGTGPSALLPSLGFGAILALNLLTKGLIGLVFPLLFVFLYLLLTRQLRLVARLHVLPSALVFAAVALPWHILAALRNPAIAMPPGVGLPARAGWAWFYLYNEHIARFLGQRIPHDYGNTPVWIFWTYAIVWIMPWAAFLPAAFVMLRRQLGHRIAVKVREREAALALILWSLIVMVFFTISSRQEYYSLPALPALALMAGGVLAKAERTQAASLTDSDQITASLSQMVLACQKWILLPLALVVAGFCVFFAVDSPRPRPGTDISSLLALNPALYNLSLGHVFDLTGAAMGLFRGPLLLVAAGMLTLGVGGFLLRRKGLCYAANLTVASGMIAVLLAAHVGLERFYPVLGSRSLAEAILTQQQRTRDSAKPSTGLILVDGELTSASSLLFYTHEPLHLIDGRVNGPWFGSFWPDAPPIFESDASLKTLWAGQRRVFLLTYDPGGRARELAPIATVRQIASAGGKTVLSNR